MLENLKKRFKKLNKYFIIITTLFFCGVMVFGGTLSQTTVNIIILLALGMIMLNQEKLKDELLDDVDD